MLAPSTVVVIDALSLPSAAKERLVILQEKIDKELEKIKKLVD